MSPCSDSSQRTSWEKEIGRAIRVLEKRIIWVPKDFFSKSLKTAGDKHARFYQVKFSPFGFKPGNFPVFSIFVYLDLPLTG